MKNKSTQLQRWYQNLKRRQEQLQLLLELERNWPKQAEDGQLPALIATKRRLLANLDSLLRDAAGIDGELEAQRANLPESERREMEAAMEGLKSQLAVIVELHRQNLAKLEDGLARTGRELLQVRQELEIMRELRRTGRRTARVDVLG